MIQRGISTVMVREMQKKLSLKAEKDKEHKFGDLYSLLCQKDWLGMAWEKVKTNTGSRTAGVDKVTRSNFERDEQGILARLLEKLKQDTFKPSPVRRTYIREVKSSGRIKMRPLGIPNLEDRIVQEATRMILEPIFEPDFSRNSFGFRPGRSTHRAIESVWKRLLPHTGYTWVIEGDIASFFDTVNHKLMLRFLKRRIKDKKLLKLIWKFLRSGIMEEGSIRNTTIGTPQGGIISPLLANIYLNEFDRYMERITKRSAWKRNDNRKKGIANFQYTRYADDFVVLCSGTRGQAEVMKQEISNFLATELKLELAWDKTKVTHIQDGFMFLGFHLSGGIGSSGKVIVRLRIPEEAVKKAMQKIDILLKARTDMSVNAKIQALNSVIRGWCQYYQYATVPIFMFKKLEYKVFWDMAHWLGKKFKLQMPEVMRRYRQENTFGTSTTKLVLPTKYKNKRLLFRLATNPYTGKTEPGYEEVIDLDELWTGREVRPGSLDLKEQVYVRDGGKCGLCGEKVEWKGAELDHRTLRSTFRDVNEADRLKNLWILPPECHRQKTYEQLA
jgi:RNA-directed DNA polymerase